MLIELIKMCVQMLLGHGQSGVAENEYDVVTISGGFVPGHVPSSALHDLIRMCKSGELFCAPILGSITYGVTHIHCPIILTSHSLSICRSSNCLLYCLFRFQLLLQGNYWCYYQLKKSNLGQRFSVFSKQDFSAFGF